MRSRYARCAATKSASESPPNFSRAARASSKATAASATTASASTAATSLRSTSASPASPLSRSTERSGRISVGSGFIAARTTMSSPFEGGVSNGEDIVVRAAMKPLPTLMRPLRSVDLESGEAGEALVERSDVAAVEALAVVAEAAVAFELARAAREKFGGDSLGDFVAAHRAYVERIDWQPH